MLEEMWGGDVLEVGKRQIIGKHEHLLQRRPWFLVDVVVN
jgi:hypothetical protein